MLMINGRTVQSVEELLAGILVPHVEAPQDDRLLTKISDIHSDSRDG